MSTINCPHCGGLGFFGDNSTTKKMCGCCLGTGKVWRDERKHSAKTPSRAITGKREQPFVPKVPEYERCG